MEKVFYKKLSDFDFIFGNIQEENPLFDLKKLFTDLFSNVQTIGKLKKYFLVDGSLEKIIHFNNCEILSILKKIYINSDQIIKKIKKEENIFSEICFKLHFIDKQDFIDNVTIIKDTLDEHNSFPAEIIGYFSKERVSRKTHRFNIKDKYRKSFFKKVKPKPLPKPQDDTSKYYV